MVTYTDTWNFYKELSPAPSANWNAIGFVPSPPWGSGPGLLGHENAGLPPPGLQTPVQTQDLLTYYFRRQFNWNGATSGVTYSS